MEQASAKVTPVSVVLDTNVFVADFQMAGTAFSMLLTHSSRVGHKTYVPEVVFDEVVNKFREQVSKSRENIEKELRFIQRISGAGLRTPLGIRKQNEILGEYETDLYHMLIATDVSIWPYPDASHKNLVGRALNRMRPFSENGKGYRDSLVWESVKEIAMESDDQPVILVTGNTTHFCDESELLHPDLSGDISCSGIETYIKIVPSLQSFIQEYVMPGLEKLDGIREQLIQNQYPGLSLGAAVEDMVVKQFKDQQFPPSMMALPREYGEALVYHLIETTNIDVADVRRYDDDSIWVTAVCDVRCLVSFLINKAFYYTIPPGESPYIWNPDYDTEHVAGASEKCVRVRLSFILNEKSHEIAH